MKGSPPGFGRAGWGVVVLVLAYLALGLGADWMPLASPYKRHLAAGMLRLVLLTLGTGWLLAWWVGRARGVALAVHPRTAWIATAAGVGAYAAGLSILSLVRHRALLTGIWDLGYYAQITWGLAQLRVPRSSIWSDAPWGNHATFILVVAAPLLRVFPDPATLLVLQSVVLALGAVPAFLLARRVWEQPLAGVVAAGAYLLYPPLQFANLFDFHADTFATPIFLAAFAALFAGWAAWALAWAGLLVLVKEDMALVAVAFGLYVAVVHRRRSGLLLAAAAAVAFVLLVWILIPGWTKSPYFPLFNRWGHLGKTPWELIASPVLRPAAFFGTLLQPERLGYLLLLLAPLAGLPLFAPEILAVGLPPLASNLLSALEPQYTIRGHYTATLTPVLVAAAVVGGRRAAAWLERAGAAPLGVLAGLAATSVVASLAFSPLPWSQDSFARKQFWDATPRRGLVAIAGRVPPDASLCAANHLGAHFALRRTLRLFPRGQETADLVLVDVHGLDYVGAGPNSEVFRPLLRSLVETRPLVAIEDGLALFGRGAPSPGTVMRLVNLRPLPASGARQAGDLALVAAALTPSRLAPRANLRARYTWAATAGGRGTPCIAEALVHPGGSPAWESRRPMLHGLLPGERWPTGWAADEAIVAVVPETVPPGAYAWAVTTWYGPGGDACRGAPVGVPRLAVAEVRVDPW